MSATKIFLVITMALFTSSTMGCVGTESDDVDVDEGAAAMVTAAGPAAAAAPGRLAIPAQAQPSNWMPGPDDDDEPGPPQIPHRGSVAGLDDDDCAPAPQVGPWHREEAPIAPVR